LSFLNHTWKKKGEDNTKMPDANGNGNGNSMQKPHDNKKESG